MGMRTLLLPQVRKRQAAALPPRCYLPHSTGSNTLRRGQRAPDMRQREASCFRMDYVLPWNTAVGILGIIPCACNRAVTLGRSLC